MKKIVMLLIGVCFLEAQSISQQLIDEAGGSVATTPLPEKEQAKLKKLLDAIKCFPKAKLCRQGDKTLNYDEVINGKHGVYYRCNSHGGFKGGQCRSWTKVDPSATSNTPRTANAQACVCVGTLPYVGKDGKPTFDCCDARDRVLYPIVLHIDPRKGDSYSFTDKNGVKHTWYKGAGLGPVIDAGHLPGHKPIPTYAGQFANKPGHKPYPNRQSVTK
ncbi:hypothetical protein A3F66_01890 [candidate division TM6 bacterium RIFCSPHIGHO2_12_FULL_32_22]|nr:MAG: hypothetical protein A3F66_01890 [candidate division TM6 bacterium RIFCSPHIGHO2_12_FULL_32_22]